MHFSNGNVYKVHTKQDVVLRFVVVYIISWSDYVWTVG